MLDAEFLEQIQEVVAACTRENVQKTVFSATLPANAEKIAMDMLRDPIRVVVGLKYVLRRRSLLLFVIIYGLLQRHAIAPHCAVADICRRRLFKTPYSSHIPISTLQSSRTDLHLVPAPSFVTGGRACACWRRKRGLSARGNDPTATRGRYQPYA